MGENRVVTRHTHTHAHTELRVGVLHELKLVGVCAVHHAIQESGRKGLQLGGNTAIQFSCLNEGDGTDAKSNWKS